MQKLHLIGFTTDLDGLIFSARRGTKSGGFTVEIDDDLIRTIEEVMRLRANGDEEWADSEERQPTAAWRVTVPQPESVLTPREIQARLRTGVSLSEVAEEAGVDEDWVARFAPPVWAEQARIIGTAQRLTFEKPRVGPSAEPLGSSVRTNLLERGAGVDDDTFDAAWGAYHVTGSTWVVTFDPPGRTRRQVAMWQFDTAAETVTAANRSASDLGYTTGKSRRRSRQQDAASEETLARVARTATKKSAARQEAAAKKASASKARKKKTAPRAVARPVAVKVPARKAPARKATPARPTKAVKATPKKVAAKKAAAPKKAAKRSPAATRQPAKKPKAPPPEARFRAEERLPAPLPPPLPPQPEREARPRQDAVTPAPIETAAAREERRRAREERRAAALAAVARERAPEPEPAAPPVRVASLAPAPEERRPAPPVIAAAMASDEAAGRVVRINATRATPVATETAAPSRRSRMSERRRRRMFRDD